MSKEFNQLKNDLKEISDLMDKVVENWEQVEEEEFNKLAEKYPEYLPSFDEFNTDFSSWIKRIEDNNQD